MRADMGIMSFPKFFIVTFVIILLNENLFCNGYNGVQQPVAYQLQPVKQGYYGQPLTTNGFQHQPASIGYIQQGQQPQVRYVQQPQQAQIQYFQQPQQAQVQYIQQPQQAQVQYVQQPQQAQIHYVKQPQLQAQTRPAPINMAKPVKPQKEIKSENKMPSAQTVKSTAEPVKYSIRMAQNAKPENYISQESPYPQGYQIYQSPYPQTYAMPQNYQTYAQSYPHTQTYPIAQNYPIYTQTYSTPEISYPQGYPISDTSFTQGYPVSDTSYPQGYPIPQLPYPHETISFSPPQVVEGPNYIETSPKYLLQNVRGSTYPYGDPNVEIYPRLQTTLHKEVTKLPETIQTPEGPIQVELIDVMPYRPGTEPVMKKPRVDSIEAVVKNESPEEIETNSIESTTRGKSFFGL